MSQFPPDAPPPPPPPPPPGGMPPGGGMPMGGANQPAEGAAAIKYGWEKFKANWGDILVPVLIGFAVVVVLEIIGFVIFGAITSGTERCVNFGTTSAGRVCGTESVGLIPTLFGIAFLMTLIFIGQFVLNLIVIRGSLLLIKGEKLSTAQLISMENLGPYAVASVIVALLAGVGILLCVLPGLAVLFFTHFYGYFVVDKKLAPMDAIKASVELVKDNIGPVAIFFLLSWVVMLVGQAACGIGVIVAWPVVVIATGYMYKRLQGEPVAA